MLDHQKVEVTYSYMAENFFIIRYFRYHCMQCNIWVRGRVCCSANDSSTHHWPQLQLWDPSVLDICTTATPYNPNIATIVSGGKKSAVKKSVTFDRLTFLATFSRSFSSHLEISDLKRKICFKITSNLPWAQWLLYKYWNVTSYL